MSSEWSKEVNEAEEELNAKSKTMAKLKSEYTHNLNKLTESYYPRMAPLHTQVYQSRKLQTYIDIEIAYKTKKQALLENIVNPKSFNELVALKEVRATEIDAMRKNFDKSIAALEAVTKEEMSVMRKYEHPPQVVLDAIEAVYVLRGDNNFTWEDARVLLCDTYFFGFFIAKAKSYDINAVTEEMMDKLTPLILSPDFEIGNVANASVPGGAMASWVHAVYDGARLVRILQPKDETVEAVRESIAIARAQLQRKKDEVFGAEQKLEALQQEYEQRRKDLKHRYDQAMMPLQEAFFEAHHHFTQTLASSPTKHQQP